MESPGLITASAGDFRAALPDDIPLFWANLRADVARRVTAWQARK